MAIITKFVPGGDFYINLVSAEVKVSAYDIFKAALQRDGIVGCVDEELDELYNEYARMGKVPDAVTEFCQAVLEGKKPYKKSDGSVAVLA